MLSADGNDPRRLARMAVMERSVVPVRHVAEAGRRYEPDKRFRTELLNALPSAPPPKVRRASAPDTFCGHDRIHTSRSRIGGGMAAACSRSTQKSRVTNAERILSALDRRLDHEVSLVIYGRGDPRSGRATRGIERAKPPVREMVRKTG